MPSRAAFVPRPARPTLTGEGSPIGIVDELAPATVREIDRPARAVRRRAAAASLAGGHRVHTVGDFDHAVILVRDLDAAERRFAELGFTTTPRGYHSAHMGTANSTVVLPDRRTYFELLAVRNPTPANAVQRAWLARREGLYGLAFKTADARAAAAAFDREGIGAGEAVDFARVVELADGPRDARFTVARSREGATPGAWCFVCQHHTPDLVWRADHLVQANGARSLVEIVGVAPNPAALEADWRRLFGERVRRADETLEIRTGTARILFETPAALRRRFAAALDGVDLDEPALVALVFAVADTDAARASLERAGIAWAQGPDGELHLSARAAFGLAIAFRPAAAG